MKTYAKTVMAAWLFGLSALLQAQTLDLVNFQDQWGNAQNLNPETRWLVISRAMSSGDIVKDTFDALSIEDPQKYDMLYVADISGMPGLISKFVALPKMRNYAFPIALAREKGQLTDMGIPLEEPEWITVLTLQSLEIEGVESFNDPASFSAFLRESVLQ